jgi:hypothetical protein
MACIWKKNQNPKLLSPRLKFAACLSFLLQEELSCTNVHFVLYIIIS